MNCQYGDCQIELTGKQRKYCGDTHRVEAHKKRKAKVTKAARSRKRETDSSEAAIRTITELGLAGKLMDGTLTQAELASLTGFNQATISRVKFALEVRAEAQHLQDEWEIDDVYRNMLALDEPDPEHMKLGDPVFTAFLDDAVESFIRFRSQPEFFAARKGKPYLTAPCHRRWIRALLRTIYLGGKQLILSPPRHGKSELLIHFAIWLILRDPTIRILWVGASGELAHIMVNLVRRHLEINERLLEKFLPPGVTFKPARRGGATWASGVFTVQQAPLDNKMATMTAVGRGGTILSLDVDLLVMDDIEDSRSVAEDHQRSRTRRWIFVSLDSRVEEHTAWVGIGSRQHDDDYYGYAINDPEWQTIVEEAHATDASLDSFEKPCTLDLDDIDAHVHCMLIPELRSYRWLRSKKNSSDALSMGHLFDMVYLNRTRPEGFLVFSEDAIDASKNVVRRLGLPRFPDDKLQRTLHLCGGLDPSATQYQASFIWAFDVLNERKYMVDLVNHHGGGLEAALDVFKWAYELYDVKHWVIEDMAFQRGYREDDKIANWAAEHDVFLEGHSTGSNKYDELYGVGAMNRDFVEEIVDLPYGDEPARTKTDLFRRQALGFSDEQRLNRNRKTDVLMAAWFPQKVYRRLRAEYQAKTISAPYAASYRGFDITQIGEAPW